MLLLPKHRGLWLLCTLNMKGEQEKPITVVHLSQLSRYCCYSKSENENHWKGSFCCLRGLKKYLHYVIVEAVEDSGLFLRLYQALGETSGEVRTAVQVADPILISCFAFPDWTLCSSVESVEWLCSGLDCDSSLKPHIFPTSVPSEMNLLSV